MSKESLIGAKVTYFPTDAGPGQPGVIQAIHPAGKRDDGIFVDVLLDSRTNESPSDLRRNLPLIESEAQKPGPGKDYCLLAKTGQAQQAKPQGAAR